MTGVIGTRRGPRRSKRTSDGSALAALSALDHQLAWFWHDHFAVSFQVVKSLPMMLEHLERCWALGRGNFRKLIREITTDPAMLVFLDGNTSTGDAPNENYGRELLELYTVGINNFSEADVAAAAAALTGWVVRRSDGHAQFVARRHDDSPQTLLGVDGVHDVDTTVAAVTGSPACPVFIAARWPGTSSVMSYHNDLRTRFGLCRGRSRHCNPDPGDPPSGRGGRPHRRCSLHSHGWHRYSRPRCPAETVSWPERFGRWARFLGILPTSAGTPVRRHGWRLGDRRSFFGVNGDRPGN